MDIDRIVVLGTASLGRGIIERLSFAGLAVHGFDPNTRNLTQAKQWLQEMRGLLVATGLMPSERRNTAVRMTTFELDIEQALHGVDMIIDATDHLDADTRNTIYANVALSAPEYAVIILDADVADIQAPPAALASRSAAIIGAKWYQPISVLRRVEIQGTEHSNPALIENISAVFSRAGINTVPPDSRQFDVADRLRMALIREALTLMAESGIPAEAIDDAARMIIGPQTTAAGIFGYMGTMGDARVRAWLKRELPKLSASTEVLKLLKEKIDGGEITFIETDRDNDDGPVAGYERILARIFMLLNPDREA